MNNTSQMKAFQQQSPHTLNNNSAFINQNTSPNGDFQGGAESYVVHN